MMGLNPKPARGSSSTANWIPASSSAAFAIPSATGSSLSNTTANLRVGSGRCIASFFLPQGLLVIRGRGGVRLPDSTVLYPHAAFGHASQLLAGLVVEVPGDVFSRWIEFGERLQVVEHLVVDALDDGAHHQLELFEVEQQAGRVQRFSGEGDADLVIVAVRVLTLAVVIAEVVAGRKAGVHGDFIHEILRDPRGSVPLSF